MSRLFNLGKIGQSNLATWDAILVLYRGTTGAVDRALLKIISFIEGRLSRSFAARISAWNFLDVAEVPLMHKQKNQIILTVDAKRLYRSVSRPIIERGELQNKDFDDLDRFMDFVDIDVCHDSDFYDPQFMLPVLTFSVMNKAQLDVYTAIERNCLSYALTHLSSRLAGVRGMVVGFLNTLAHVTEVIQLHPIVEMSLTSIRQHTRTEKRPRWYISSPPSSPVWRCATSRRSQSQVSTPSS